MEGSLPAESGVKTHRHRGKCSHGEREGTERWEGKGKVGKSQEIGEVSQTPRWTRAQLWQRNKVSSEKNTATEFYSNRIPEGEF